LRRCDISPLLIHLSQAYFTFLPPISPFTGTQTRASARSNITNMLQLHTELLEDLHQVIPYSEHDQAITETTTPKRKPYHVRWHSEDSIPVRRPPLGTSHTGWSNRLSLDSHKTTIQDPLSLTCTPITAADVGRIFAKNVGIPSQPLVKLGADKIDRLSVLPCMKSTVQGASQCMTISISPRGRLSLSGITTERSKHSRLL
jgi:hypothetical protein